MFCFESDHFKSGVLFHLEVLVTAPYFGAFNDNLDTKTQTLCWKVQNTVSSISLHRLIYQCGFSGKYSFTQNMNGGEHNGGSRGRARSLARSRRSRERRRSDVTGLKPGSSRWVPAERRAGVRGELFLMNAGRVGPVCRGDCSLPPQRSWKHPPAGTQLSDEPLFFPCREQNPACCPASLPTQNRVSVRVVSHHTGGSRVVRRADSAHSSNKQREKSRKTNSSEVKRSADSMRFFCAQWPRAVWCFRGFEQIERRRFLFLFFPLPRLCVLSVIVWRAVRKHAQVRGCAAVWWHRPTLFVLVLRLKVWQAESPVESDVRQRENRRLGLAETAF